MTRRLTPEQATLVETWVLYARKRAYSFCRHRKLRDREEALSVAFEALATASLTFDPARGFQWSTYLHHAVVNALCKWAARLRRVRERQLGGYDPPARERAAPGAAAADDLRAALALIDPLDAEALRLREVLGWRFADIALRQRCGRAEAVRRAGRALRELRRYAES